MMIEMKEMVMITAITIETEIEDHHQDTSQSEPRYMRATSRGTGISNG